MTKEQWKKVEDWWGTGHGHVEMEIDGYKITLYNIIDKKRMAAMVEIYVNDYIKGEYSDIKNEIGNCFWLRIKKSLHSAKRLKEMAKVFGKRSKMAQQVYCEYNLPYWRSFSAFKRHMTTCNTDIRLILCGWEESEATDAKDD